MKDLTTILTTADLFTDAEYIDHLNKLATFFRDDQILMSASGGTRLFEYEGNMWVRKPYIKQ